MLRAIRPRTFSAGLIALAVALISAACGSSGVRPAPAPETAAAVSPPGSVKSLVIANAVKVDTLDPAQNSVNESIWLDQNLYSSLLQPNATGTGLLPDLATSWDVSKNGMKYTFHLQPEALWSDGSPVTADDVAYSLNRSKNTDGGWSSCSPR